MENCILIGLHAGADLDEDAEGVVIIGDNIRSLDRDQSNAVFFDSHPKLVFSRDVWDAIGKELNLDVWQNARFVDEEQI